MTPPPGILVLLRILPETERLVEMGYRVGIGILVGLVSQRLLFLVVGRVESWIVRVGRDSTHARQRSHTIGQIFRNLITVLVAGAVVIHALGVLGWDVKPLLAGAGILGVALGFGAQTLVRDVIAGLFIITEDQFAVGDLIEVNGKAATVEVLTVRSTTLRDFNGHLHFVPNGEMKIVTNRSRGWNRLAVDVPVAADENLDRVLELCGRIAAVMSAETAWKPRLLDEVQLWGVEALGPTESQIRLVVRARPGPDAQDAARELRRRIQGGLVGEGIRTSVQRDIGITRMTAAEGSGGSNATA
jgi:small conductance mechanosensitive channel